MEPLPSPYPFEAPNSMEHVLELEMQPQPNDTTCGPTCLHAVYRYYQDAVGLGQVVGEVPERLTGGTMAVTLACHALRRGYRATIYTYNLHLFDPTWFEAPGAKIPELLQLQRRYKPDPRLQQETDGYLEFFALGGRLRFQELTTALIRRYLNRGRPILTGLSATYLYQCAREYNDDFDDVRGEPSGHYVVLGGYSLDRRKVTVWDPLQDNPRFDGHRYTVSVGRVLGAILLGGLTHDANLLIIEPKSTP
jgi:hypothetical protein